MANVINTRIQLKYDTLANWQEKNPTLLSGEIAIATIGNSHTTTTPDNGTHPVVFKVGPGAYNDLPFTSALAADVYAWAKEDKLTITKNGTGNVVAGIEWDTTANNGKGGIKFTTASVATAEGLEELQETVAGINQTLATYGDIVTHNVDEFQAAGDYKTKQNAVAEKGAANQTLKISQNENGEITTEAIDIAIVHTQVSGLGTAATTDASAYATAAQGTKADNAAPQATTYTKTEVEGLVKTAKDAADAAQGTANEAKIKIDTFLGTITPDGSAEIIDTLSEINENITENTDAFTGLSTRVTNIENGTTKVGNADKLDGLDSTAFATAEQGIKADNAEQWLNTFFGNEAPEAEERNFAALNRRIDENNTLISEIIDGTQEVGKTTGELTFTSTQNGSLTNFFVDVNGKTFNGSENIEINLTNASSAINSAIEEAKTEAMEPFATFRNEEIKTIAISGSIYDVNEAEYDGTTHYLVFNCGTASTLI